MALRSIARSTRSGRLVGPGVCRKCRPATYSDIVTFLQSCVGSMSGGAFAMILQYRRGASDPAPNPPMPVEPGTSPSSTRVVARLNDRGCHDVLLERGPLAQTVI